MTSSVSLKSNLQDWIGDITHSCLRPLLAGHFFLGGFTTHWIGAKNRHVLDIPAQHFLEAGPSGDCNQRVLDVVVDLLPSICESAVELNSTDVPLTDCSSTPKMRHYH